MNNMPLNIAMKTALIMKDQAQFHPVKYLKALVEYSVKNGIQYYEHTTAVDVEYNKHPSIITKEGHRVTCNYVISASHFPFYDDQVFYPTRMYADRSYIIAMKSTQRFPGGMYISAETPTRSLRTTAMNGEDLWLIGGEDHKTGQGKPTMEHYHALEQYAKKNFDITEYAYRWSAQDLITLDKVPYIGPITKAQKSVLVATGLRKWSMTNGTIEAKIMSDTIVEKENPYYRRSN